MKCQLYYHPRHNIMGLVFGLAVVKINERSEYMVLTKEWVYIGDL